MPLIGELFIHFALFLCIPFSNGGTSLLLTIYCVYADFVITARLRHYSRPLFLSLTTTISRRLAKRMLIIAATYVPHCRRLYYSLCRYMSASSWLMQEDVIYAIILHCEPIWLLLNTARQMMMRLMLMVKYAIYTLSAAVYRGFRAFSRRFLSLFIVNSLSLLTIIALRFAAAFHAFYFWYYNDFLTHLLYAFFIYSVFDVMPQSWHFLFRLADYFQLPE